MDPLDEITVLTAIATGVMIFAVFAGMQTF